MMQDHHYEYRPITLPEFISDAVTMCESKETGNTELYRVSYEKLLHYFTLFSAESWMIRSITLLLESYGETMRFNPDNTIHTI
jgi:hypothetical protein